jgi:cob(I)alamin adenosyltransferase
MAEYGKIYTRTGDKGETSLIGGTRVPKFHDRIEAYGTIDELKSFTGHLYDLVEQDDVRSSLKIIMELLFTAETMLAADPESGSQKQLPSLRGVDVEMLEKAIDQMNEVLPELKSFILPAGQKTASMAHICRTICRRAERLVIKLAVNTEVDEILICFLNRLSDYLFVLARYLAFINGAKDLPWISVKQAP